MPGKSASDTISVGGTTGSQSASYTGLTGNWTGNIALAFDVGIGLAFDATSALAYLEVDVTGGYRGTTATRPG